MSTDTGTPPHLVAVNGEGPLEEDEPRCLSVSYSIQDRIFMHGVRLVGIVVLLMVGSIGVFLGVQSVPTLRHYGFSFFTEFRWLPSQDIIGIAAVVVGTVEV